MKKTAFFLAVTMAAFASCKKQDALQTSNDASSSATIAVAASGSGVISATAADSVYIMQPCGRGFKRDSIAAASLPAGITDYLTANYAGYSFHKAFAINNSSGATAGYVVVIYFNDKPVGLLFDSSANFVKVLEQREKGDLGGPGWHHGGRFEDRNGMQKDTVALSALPAVVQTYFTTNYSGDTLTKAFKNRDSGYVVLSKNNGLFATVFDASGLFVKRVELPAKPGRIQDVAQSALPAAALTYLTTTYPDYVFKKAFAFTMNGALKGYVVVIDANNTKYAVEFDASGNFVHVKTIY